MNIKISVVTAVIAAALAVPTAALAVDRVEEQSVTPSSERLYAMPEKPRAKAPAKGKKTKKIRLEPDKSFVAKGKIKYLVSVTEGYDNNASLDSDRREDSFTQTFFRASFLSPLTDKTTGVLDYELLNLMYPSETALNLVKNGVRAGVDHKLTSNLVLSASYAFDYIKYIEKKNDDGFADDYMDNSMEFKVRHQIAEKLYHSLSYDILFRDFKERKTRITAATYTTKERSDLRNTLAYEVGKYFKKDLIKVRGEYYNNNSNEEYLKYYDYDSYKIGASLTHLFTNKISGVLSWYKQYRAFQSRTLINDAGSHELDKTDLATAALFYSVNRELSFGLNYTYRQNDSNEPSNAYSGSLISVSTYYKF